MKLHNDIGLIGDFLGTIPVMIELAKREKEKKDQLTVVIHSEVTEIFQMIPRKYDIQRTYTPYNFDASLDLNKAFDIASKNNYHMTQAHFAIMGLPVPEKPIVPDLELVTSVFGIPQFDYVLAPFSRSLPEEQKWQQYKWQDLIDELSDKHFGIIGGPFNDRDFIDQNSKNLETVFSKGWNYIGCLLRMSGALISVVSGPSHMAYAVNAKNILLTNQTGAWGNNPDAIKITKNIHDITVDDVIKILKENE